MTLRKRLKIISSAVFFAFCVLAIIASNSSSKFASPFKTSPSPASEDSLRVVEGSSVSAAPSPGSAAVSSGDVQGRSERQEGYKVVKVVDGDTIDVDIDGEKQRLRMIGIDTPETVDPRKSVQCFGKAASDKAKEILTNKFVTLEADPTQGDKDKYSRLLRYVFLPDGTNYGLFMIAEGYAHEYTYNLPYKYQAEFKQAETQARNSEKGLWSPSTCNGVTK